MAQALDDGADINVPDSNNKTPLQTTIAASGNSEVLALLLLYNQTNTQSRNERGDTLMHVAVRSGYTHLFRRLARGAEALRVWNRDGVTTLHMAVVRGLGSIAMLEELNHIFAGKEIHPDTILDHEGKSALHVAVLRGSALHAISILAVYMSRQPSVTGQAYPGDQIETDGRICESLRKCSQNSMISHLGQA